MARTASAAARARFTGIARVNIDYGNTTFKGLVGDKSLQLPESPRVVNAPFFSSNFYSLPNVRQVFHCNRLSSWGRFQTCPYNAIHYAPTDEMIQRFHPALLTTRRASQSSFGTPSAFRLQRLAQLRIPSPHIHSLLARKPQTVTAGRQILNTQINSDDVSPTTGSKNVPFKHDMQIEPLVFGLEL